MGHCGTYSKEGDFFLSGVAGTDSFNTTKGAYQTIHKGASDSYYFAESPITQPDIIITRLNNSGTNVIFCTFLGGATNAEYPHSTIVDNDGNLLIMGKTGSADYPVTTTNYGPGGGFADIFVSKLSADGTQLLSSCKIGGTGYDGINIKFPWTVNTRPPYPSPLSLQQYPGDDARGNITIDNNNAIYIVSCTQSNDFPVTANAVQKNNKGGAYKQDAVLRKFSPDLKNLLYSSYLGGSGDDAAYSVNINPVTKDIYVAGVTASTDFTGNTNNAIFATNQSGNADGFVSRFSNDGSILYKTTYMGTSGMDNIYAITSDKKGYIYITGTTTGNWPLVNALFSQKNGKQFICKLQPDLSSFVYSTVFGTDTSLPNIVTTAFLWTSVSMCTLQVMVEQEMQDHVFRDQ